MGGGRLVIFTRGSRTDDTVVSSESEDELDTRTRPIVRIVAAILVVSLFILMTDLFFSLVLNR
ncbi:MAG: hypothetical protein QOK47_255 [Actinomycetota bacterium]|nr:hypothetical protein [Actinomycetota bacterium]